MKFLNRVRSAVRKAQKSMIKAGAGVQTVLADTRGDLSTTTIGGIIVGVVIVGLLVTAVTAFFPDFFENMFSAMETNLGANW